MPTSSRVVHVGLVDGLAKGPPPPGNLAVPIFSHGSLVVELYTLVGQDPREASRGLSDIRPLTPIVPKSI